MEIGKQTKGVKTLLGNPKKAIMKLSVPMVIAMSAQTIYNLADAIWVSGIGPKALAAVGFVFPFFFFAMALSNGIGIGGGSAISRKIGEKNKEGADNVATHTIIIMLITAIIVSVTMLILTEPILKFMGAGNALEQSTIYARIIFSGLIFIFFLQTTFSILRSEGDAKRAMYGMLAGVILNIILDPIFIYILHLGVAGAAYATVISMFIVSLVSFYWLFIDKKTFVSFHFKHFKFDKKVVYDISRVGIPASISQTSMSLMAFFLISIIAKVGGTNGVAVYTTGWRIITMAIMPLLGIASAVTSVVGAAFGSKNYKNIKIAYYYAIKIGVVSEIILSLIIYFFAPQIALIFTWSKQTQILQPDIIQFLQIICFMIITAPFGMTASSMFQGTAKGINALIMTILRTLVFTIPYAWFLGIHYNWGLKGVWLGMLFAGFTYIPIAFIWANLYMKKLSKL